MSSLTTCLNRTQETKYVKYSGDVNIPGKAV